MKRTDLNVNNFDEAGTKTISLKAEEFDKAETRHTGLGVNQFDRAGTKPIGLEVKQFDEAKSRRMGLSVKKFDGAETLLIRLSIDNFDKIRNKERGSELTDCMSGAGRVSIISDAPATQSIYCQWHADENTSVRHEAGEATQAWHGWQSRRKDTNST